MERRDFLKLAAMTAAPFTGNEPIAAPLHRVMDGITPCAPEHIRRFWDRTWPEAFRDFQRAGVEWQTTDAAGEVRRSPGDRPIFIGLRRGVINLVLTDHIPMHWDRGRA